MKSLFSFVFGAVAVVTSLPVLAQDVKNWPDGDIRYVLHVKPGGATDVLARKLADGMQQELDVDIVVENRPGGSGANQVVQLQRAKPDGQTIGAVTLSHLTMFAENDKFDVDSVAWACRLVLDPYLIAVRSDSDVKSLDDLVAKANANPRSVTMAGYGQREIAWMMFEEAADLNSGDINWVPYDSVSNGITSVLGGHNDAVLAYVGLVRQHVEKGDMRILGVMGDERAERFPDVPTMEEAGFPIDTSWMLFRGIIMPKDTPLEIQNAVCDAAKTVMEGPEMQKYIADSELVYGFMPPEEFQSFVAGQEKLTSKWLGQL